MIRFRGTGRSSSQLQTTAYVLHKHRPRVEKDAIAWAREGSISGQRQIVNDWTCPPADGARRHEAHWMPRLDDFQDPWLRAPVHGATIMWAGAQAGTMPLR